VKVTLDDLSPGEGKACMEIKEKERKGWSPYVAGALTG
jgi:hypothetical protein